MVCVKLLIVDVDGVLANNGEVLREIKKKYPNIAQLFHFRKSHHVHFVGPATTQIDIVNASNDVYHAAGEPFALTAEHATIFVSLVMTHTSDAIEKLLEGIFRETEKFARDDKLRPGWRVSGPMYGVCASTPERRRELMELCIAKINKAYDVKLVLMAEPFRVHIGVPMFSDAASAATQSAWGGDTWSAASYHAPAYPNTMVAHQGLIQQSRLQPHLGSGIIVAAPSNNHLAAFGFAQDTVSEQAREEELLNDVSNARNQPEVVAHTSNSRNQSEFPTSSRNQAEAHASIPFWNAPIVAQQPSAFINSVRPPHAEFQTSVQTSVEQPAALTAIPPRVVSGDVASRVALWPTSNTSTTQPHLIPASLLSAEQYAASQRPSSHVLRTDARPFVPPGMTNNSSNPATVPFTQLAVVAAAAAPLVVPSANNTRSTTYDPAPKLERRFLVTGVDSSTIVAAVAEFQKLINVLGLLVIHLASLSEVASAVTISAAAVEQKAATVDPIVVAQLIALGEDFMLSRCGAGPYMLELPATELLKRFFKKGSKGHAEQLSLACHCLRRNESLEITGDLNKGIATVSVIVRGMKGRDLRDRAENVIIPAVKECLECEAIEDICVPLGLFNLLADQNGLCVTSKNVDSNEDVEGAYLLGLKNARNQLTVDVNTFTNQ